MYHYVLAPTNTVYPIVKALAVWDCLGISHVACHGTRVSADREVDKLGEVLMSRQEPSMGKSVISQPQPDERLLTPREVAALFRVDPKTVTRWASAGRIGSIRTQGGHRRFRETEVRALLASLTSSAPLGPKEDDSGLAVSIYLEDGREPTVRGVQSALQAVAKEIGFDLIAEFDPIYGSFWQRFRAKASDPHTREEVYERLIKLERSAEVRLLAVPESQANMQNAQGLAAIIESLKGESAAVVQLGPLVVVKASTSDLGSAILCKVLTAKELKILEARPDLLRDPSRLMAQLTEPSRDDSIELAQ